MSTIKDLRIFLLLLGVLVNLSQAAPKVLAGSFGAEIFCTMRDGGNDHESSWEAAYSYIKQQKGGFFKTSPKQAANEIIETVIREKDKFGNCIEYLDKLYPDRELQRKLIKDEKEQILETTERENRQKKIESLKEYESGEISEESFDRYDF
tara:strand:+ start:211 stop:663 length:453 start_codon:yes stop_codon:yes gene_type:complete